jgi:tRNA(Arg) A34 adenosine deaminase TadA
VAAPPYRPTPEDRALARRLAAGHAGEVAFLRGPGGRIYFARCAPGPREPRSAALDLIQGVWQARRDRAHALLRSRILSTGPVHGLDRAAVKVAAKKVAAVTPAEQGDAPGAMAIDLGPAAARARALAREEGAVEAPDTRGWSAEDRAAWVLQAAAGLAPSGPLKTRDRAVVAALFGPDGAALAAARNTSGDNRLLHAEVNLAQGWFHRTGRGLPDGAQLIVSLQCCRMCAAMLVGCAEGALDVVFCEADPGRFARFTALQRLGLERPLSPR